MRFVISRKSIWNDSQPCDDAKRQTIEYWEQRTCTEEEFDKKQAPREGLWRSVGTDHMRVTPSGRISKTGSHIVRKRKKEEWVLDIEPGYLMTLYEKYGSIIIEPLFYDHAPDGCCPIPHIVINDANYD